MIITTFRALTLRPTGAEKFPASGLLVGSAWIGCAAIHTLDDALFPAAGSFLSVAAIICLSGGSILGGLLAGGVLQVANATLRLLAGLILVNLAVSTIWLATEVVMPAGGSLALTMQLLFLLWLIVASGRLIWRASPDGAVRTTKARKSMAVAAFVVAILACQFVQFAEEPFYRLKRLVREDPAQADAKALAPQFDAETVWTSQQRLLAAANGRLTPQTPGRPDLYAIAVAPHGYQALFSREAHLAADLFDRSDGRQRSVILSNDGRDVASLPLANRTNFSAAAGMIGKLIDPSEDAIVVYIASHGSSDGSVATALPDYSRSLKPLSADAVASALEQSGIRRRIFIVSACHAGSWIPRLRNENTIVIAASAADRASFGRSDDRRLTYFGEAFLEDSLKPGISLSAAFRRSQAIIAKWETAENLTPSKPQAFVGRNMRALWAAAR